MTLETREFPAGLPQSTLENFQVVQEDTKDPEAKARRPDSVTPVMMFANRRFKYTWTAIWAFPPRHRREARFEWDVPANVWRDDTARKEIKRLSRMIEQARLDPRPIEDDERVARETMKTIVYRDVVLFHVPAHWIESVEEDTGCGIYYEDVPDSGTLRVCLQEVDAGSPAAFEGGGRHRVRDLLEEVMRDWGKKIACPEGLQMKTFPSGATRVKFESVSEEEGERIRQYWWVIATGIRNRLSIATFNFTILAHQSDDPYFMNQIAMLDREIENAHVGAHHVYVG